MLLFVADNKHIGYFLKLGIAYFRIHALWRVIQLYSNTLVEKALHYFLGIGEVAVSYRDYTDLYRGKPDRKCSCIMLNQYCSKALN